MRRPKRNFGASSCWLKCFFWLKCAVAFGAVGAAFAGVAVLHFGLREQSAPLLFIASALLFPFMLMKTVAPRRR